MGDYITVNASSGDNTGSTANLSPSEVVLRVIPGTGKSKEHFSSAKTPHAGSTAAYSTGRKVVENNQNAAHNSTSTKKSTTTPLTSTYPPKPLGYRFVKRAFDIAFSSAVIAVGAIPGALLSVAVAIDTKGAPFYSQTRIGRFGRPFKMYKFRTMVADSDNVEKYLNEEQLQQWHQERKVDNDPRITPLGRKLRRLSIDEFPQFINVWLGQISTIGPRVITEEEMAWFGEDREKLLSVPPGITGLWQTGPRNKVCFEDGSRQELELSYVDKASLGLDAKIFFETFPTMLKGTGQ